HTPPELHTLSLHDALPIYVGEMIRFYLDEEPILKNVPTWQCRKPEELSHVLANLSELVVKETQGSGGYGMLVGPAATQAEIEARSEEHTSELQSRENLVCR